MPNGFVLGPDDGHKIVGGGLDVNVKIGENHTHRSSTFVIGLAPGYDVGAHVHAEAEEIFYVLEGQLDLMAFEPTVRTEGNWQAWESAAGDKVVRGGPGSMLFVPPGCPHAFTNPGPVPARILFQAAPAGHERYFEELVELLRRPGPPDKAKIIELRRRHDIEQLTTLVPAPSS